MRSISNDNFGLVIAYLLPGFVAVWGIGHFLPTVQNWLAAYSETSPTVGGFLYLTLASMAAGLIVSTARWGIVDTLLHRTGIRKPDWNYRRFAGREAAFEAVVENMYRYYQFHANMLVAVTFSFAVDLASRGVWPLRWLDVGFGLVWLLLYCGSRDTLSKYYSRGTEVLE